MSMSTLMCPHCGGRLLIDPTLRLQSMLTCPYCARKSLMLNKNGMIVLRGIIASNTPNAQSVAHATPDEPLSNTEDDVGKEKPDIELGGGPLDVGQPVVSVDESPEVDRPVEPAGEPDIEPELPQSVTSEAAAAEEPKAPQPVEPDPEQPVAPEEEPTFSHESERVVSPDADRSIDSVTSTASIPNIVDQEAPSIEPENAPVDLASSEDAEANETLEAAPNTLEPESRQEHLIDLATRAANEGSIMAFNSYSRQAIDCDPTDPRMYVLRSRLIEQAHGFARATFLSPVWMSYTPRQKAFVIAQHFSSFNAAVFYSTEPDRAVHAADTGRLIAWQIRESIIENARLRLGKRPFNGKFHRQDLGTAARIIDSLRSVNETVVPYVADELLRSIRVELDRLDPKLYFKLLRSGF